MKRISDIFPQIQDYYFVTKDGKVYSEFSKKFLKPYLAKHGYYELRLKTKDDKYKVFLCHRLVYACFSDDSLSDELVINHKDENKLNNHISNLEQITRAENLNYGTCRKRTAQTQSKPVLQFDKNNNLIRKYSSINEAQREGFHPYGIVKSCQNAKNRATHKGFIWKYAED